MTDDVTKAIEGLVEAPSWELKMELVEARASMESAKAALEVTANRYPLPQLKIAYDEMLKLMAEAIEFLNSAQARVDPMRPTPLHADLEQQVRDGLITKREAALLQVRLNRAKDED